MKLKALYIGFAIIVLGSVFISVKYGMRPRPMPKIKLSSFETPQKLAQAVSTILFPEFSSAKVIAFGYQTEESDQLNLIKYWYQQKIADVWISDDHLSLETDFSNVEKIDSNKDRQLLYEKITQALSENKKVALILPAVFSSQLISGNVVDWLMKTKQLPITSFSIVELIRSRDNEKSARIPCLVPDADQTGMGPLGCAILQQSRSLYRKKMEPGKKVAWVDQRGIFDFLIFYSNEPEK